MRRLRFCIPALLVSFGFVACKPSASKPTDSENKIEKPTFQKQVYISVESDDETITLISAKECEIAAKPIGIILADYTIEEKVMRIVLTDRGDRRVRYFNVTEKGLVDPESGRLAYQMKSATGEQSPEALARATHRKKRKTATEVLEDLRIVDSAIDQYAIENNKAQGSPVEWDDLKRYLKSGTRLYDSGGKDMLGGAIGIKACDSPPSVSPETYKTLLDVAPVEFWTPYNP